MVQPPNPETVVVGAIAWMSCGPDQVMAFPPTAANEPVPLPPTKMIFPKFLVVGVPPDRFVRRRVISVASEGTPKHTAKEPAKLFGILRLRSTTWEKMVSPAV
jgi:hypothetical protein